MDKFVEFMRDLNLVTVTVRVILSLLCGGIIGTERGRQGRAAGMRTHILVALGASLTAMIGIYMVDAGFSSDPMRIAAQVVSGIGFLGAGTILLKGRFQITGITTAAGLWCTAAIGLSFGVGFYEGAFIVFGVSILTVTILHKIEYRVFRKYTRFGIYMEIVSDRHIKEAIRFMENSFTVTDIQVTPPRSGTAGNVGIEANIHSEKSKKLSPEIVSEVLESQEYVVYSLESI